MKLKKFVEEVVREGTNDFELPSGIMRLDIEHIWASLNHPVDEETFLRAFSDRAKELGKGDVYIEMTKDHYAPYIMIRWRPNARSDGQ